MDRPLFGTKKKIVFKWTTRENCTIDASYPYGLAMPWTMDSEPYTTCRRSFTTFGNDQTTKPIKRCIFEYISKPKKLMTLFPPVVIGSDSDIIVLATPFMEAQKNMVDQFAVLGNSPPVCTIRPCTGPQIAI